MKFANCLSATCEIVVTIILIPYYCFRCCQCCSVCCTRGPELCGTGRIQEAKRRREAEQIKKWHKERKINEPRALPPRRRALSLPRARSADKIAKPAFLRLPFEVRRQILVEVLGASVIHLVQLPKRLGHVRCQKSSYLSADEYASNPFYDLPRRCFHMDQAPRYHYDEPPQTLPVSDTCLALLLTCHQLYVEAVDVLYTTNTFDINHPQTLIFLARTIRPQRLQSIRSLQIHWTGVLHPHLLLHPEIDMGHAPDDNGTLDNMWDIIGSQMIGLKDLKLQLEYSQLQFWMSHNEYQVRVRAFVDRMLEPLRVNVKGRLRNFQLEIDGDFPDIQELQDRMREFVCGD